MPIYEYKCNRCGKEFEQLVFSSDREEDFACPSCGKKDTSRVLSSFSQGAARTGGSAGGHLSSCAPSGGFS
jgi:putative FmdB family regulatory protein